MPGQRVITNSAGVLTEIFANQVSAGAGDATKLVALDGTGRIDSSMMPVGIAPNTVLVVASEALAAGNFVNIWSNAGVVNVRKADATVAGKEANGFVLAAFASAATATVFIISQTNTQLTGLTPGSLYFLSTTAGGATLTAPSGSGNVTQTLGKATSATSLMFSPGSPITLA